MYYEQFPFITDGIVKDTEDPQQNGRLKIWCPALDGETYEIEHLPWAEYATPFGGVTNDFNAGRNKTKSNGPVSYGFWALPKNGAQVLVFLLNGDPNRRFYFASVFGLHRNRSIPAGRNINPNENPPPQGPFTDTYEPLQPAYDNLRTAFQGKVSSPQAKSRGARERQAAQDSTIKNGKDGYAPNPVDEKYLDTQAYCLVTPGHHVFLMDDAPDNCRIRLKTCEGNQIIIDDTNERIYVSTAKGKSWIELDEDGHVHIFGSQSISMRAGKDVNIFADQDLNIEVGRHINAKALTGEFRLQTKDRIDIRSEAGSIYQTACNDFHIMAKNNLYEYARDIFFRAEDSIYEEALGIYGGGNSHSVVHGNKHVLVIGTSHEHITGEYFLRTDSEMRLTGKAGVHVNSQTKINVESANVNVKAGQSINLGANNISAEGKNSITAYAAQSMNLDGGQTLHYGAPTVNTHISGGSSSTYSHFGNPAPAEESLIATPVDAALSEDASNAQEANGPSVVPGHEPWKRPASAKSRNKYWSE